jgi:methionine-rich copper-binding protein CopC
MNSRRNKTLVLSLAFVLLCVAIPVKVFAHAVLLESRPTTGAVIKGPVLSLWLRFNVRVDGSRSRCMLILPDGNIKPLSLDPQSKPDVLTTNAKQLSAGNYKLQWQVLAADGHITRGELKLNVE